MRIMITKAIFSFVLILSVNISLLASVNGDVEFETRSDIIMIGDVHGAYPALVKILQHAELIDDELNWIGGSRHFVSTGDLMDRGPQSRKIMDLLIKLQQQARQAKGYVHVLLGNHEVLNLIGDWRYISTEEYAEFAEDESPALRNQYYQEHIAFTQKPPSPQQLTEFNQQFPAGFFARLEAFMPDGYYGKWLHQLPYVIRINDEIFTHGGLSVKVIQYKNLKNLNKHLTEELSTYTAAWQAMIANKQLASTTDYIERFAYAQALLSKKRSGRDARDLVSAAQGLLFSTDSPNWYRGNAQCHPLFEAQVLRDALQSFNATRLWVGHTSASTVRQRFNETLFLMDTGMLKEVYGGHPIYARIAYQNSLNIDFINADSGQKIMPSSLPKRASINPYGLSDKALEEVLTNANVISKRMLGEGVTNPYKVELEYQGKTYTAIFKHHDSGNRNITLREESSDRYQYEIAAYRLDRMMGLNLVPVAVERIVDGKQGALQLWIEGLINYNEMSDNNISYEGFCHYQRQRQMLDVFDYLIHNADRNRGNIGFTRDDWQIWFFDHTRSFRTSAKRSKIGRKANLALTPEFRQVLEALSDEELKTLSTWLTAKQIRALIKRRDSLLSGDA